MISPYRALSFSNTTQIFYMETVDLELERKEILRRYRRLLKLAKPFLKDNDAKLIKNAFNTSLEAHK